jgi:hypothetical protein
MLASRMAQSVTSLRRTNLVVIGGKADIERSCCPLWSDANDPDRSSALVGQRTAAPRFRTIQASRTCRYLPGQPWRTVSWHSGFRGGAHARRKTARVDSLARRRGDRVAARGGRAAACDAGVRHSSRFFARVRPNFHGPAARRDCNFRRRTGLAVKAATSTIPIVSKIVLQQSGRNWTCMGRASPA